MAKTFKYDGEGNFSVQSAKRASMSEQDATRVIFGDLSHLSHKVTAERLGLTYDQVYSARYGDTFKKLTSTVKSELSQQMRVVTANLIKG